jgi:hypothetical protein
MTCTQGSCADAPQPPPPHAPRRSTPQQCVVTLDMTFVTAHGATTLPLWLSDVLLHYVPTQKRPFPPEPPPPLFAMPPAPTPRAPVPAMVPAPESKGDSGVSTEDPTYLFVLWATTLFLTGVGAARGGGGGEADPRPPPVVLIASDSNLYVAGAHCTVGRAFTSKLQRRADIE